MLRITFNHEAISQALRQAKDRLGDMTLVYVDIGEQLVLATKRRFGEGVSPEGIAWAPKSPTTIEHYRRLGYGADPRPLFGPSKRLSNEITYSASAGSVEVGSNLIYSGVMQTGAAKGALGADKRGRPIPWGNIPARPWLGLSDQDERDILDIVDEHLGAPFQG